MSRNFLILFFFFFLGIPTTALASSTSSAHLSVPYTHETPDGTWTGSWKNACEEASVAMVERFYLNDKRKNLPVVEAKKILSTLFAWEKKTFGYDADTNATETLKIINNHTGFTGTVKNDPTLDEIKQELLAGRPVITFHYGFGLKNPHHRFRVGGSSYHVLVLTGFDDQKKIFYTNDSGTDKYSGLDYRYSYDTIMNTLHDFDHKSKKADETAVAIFTAPLRWVKTSTSKRIYLVKNEVKYHIPTPAIFSSHRWPWSKVETISNEEFENLTTGESLKL